MKKQVAVCVGLLVLCLLAASCTAVSEEEKRIARLPSPDDQDLRKFCQMTDKFNENFRCWVTSSTVRQEDRKAVTYVGQGSICQRKDKSADSVFKCTPDGWTSAGGEKQLVQHRTKRWGRFRIRIRIRLRRTGCRWFGWGCPKPNRPPYFHGCPRNENRDAAPGNDKTTVHFSTPAASDHEDGSPAVNPVSGRTSGQVYPQGRTDVLFRTRDRGGLTAYCNVVVNVTVRYCTEPAPYYLVHGGQICSGDRRNINGAVCYYWCYPGYELSPSTSQIVTCQSDGQWNRPFPTCSAVDCGNPGSISGGHVSCPSGHLFPSLCLVACDPGYTHSGQIFIKCQSNKRWTTLSPCTDIEGPKFPSGCPANQKLFSGPLEAPVAVTWIDPVVTDNSGDSPTLTSSVAKGTLLDLGFHVVRITAADKTGNSASCSFVATVEAKECPALSAPFHSRLTCTRGFVEGSECTTQCDPGHELRGITKLTCLGTSQWDSVLPSCVEVTCPAVPVVDNGHYECLAGHTFQSACVLKCNGGYSPQRPLTIHCQHNATWSSPGSCLDNEPPTFVSGCTKNVGIYESRLGSPTLVQWSAPAVSDNSGQPVSLSSDVASGSAFPAGVTYVTYTATDVIGNTRECYFSVTVTTLFCPVPDLETPNRTLTLMTYTCPDGHVHGASCTLQCRHGYPLTGSDSITCERDDRTFPPTMHWEWPGPSAVRPQCQENTCPTLDPPENGALACFLANFGYDCLMSCEDRWDVPSQTDGHFYCTNSNGYWIPDRVPDCVVRILPWRVRMNSDLFYFSNTCNTSLEEIRQNFITRLNNSTWKDACRNVPSCVAENVQVQCGSLSGRRRREASVFYQSYRRQSERSTLGAWRKGREAAHLLSRGRRQAASHYVLITFQIVLEYEELTTPGEAFQQFLSLRDEILTNLRSLADEGHFNVGQLVADASSFGYPTLSADCPPGTMFTAQHTASSFSCRGCGAGHYLLNGSTQCEACHVGSYAEQDNATSCTPCPPGWSTVGPGSQSASQCKELCKAGTMSPDGFLPCQSCPAGQYQSRDGATACDHCPAGAWTLKDRSTTFSQCVAADVHLSGSNLSAQWQGQGSEFTLLLWVFLSNNASGFIYLSHHSNVSAPPISAYFHTGATNLAALPVPQNTIVAPLLVAEDTWTRLLFISDRQAGGVSVYNGDSHVQMFPDTSFPGEAPSAVTFASTDSEVVLSGFLGVDRVFDQTELDQSTQSCVTHAPENVLTWSPRATDLVLPTACDAIDECEGDPCGSHKCENQVGGYLCHCQDGWSGSTCGTPPDPCYSHQCQNEATCVSSSGNYTCHCPSEYSGAFCQLLKAHGSWSDWSTWGTCTATCGGFTQRSRVCDNPAPANGGDPCTGDTTESKLCGGSSCPVNGNWTNWGPWSGCSDSCEGGERTRSRDCSNPIPEFNGAPCDGANSETESCNTSPCPEHIEYGPWSEWSPCSVTCGVGQASRSRICNTPTPANGEDPCNGTSNETRVCTEADCPECAPLYRSAGTLLVCEEVQTPYLKTCNLTCLPGFASTRQFPLYECGEKTGHLWNQQKDASTNTELPACSVPRTFASASLAVTVGVSAGCDPVSSAAVKDGVTQNLRQLVPCVQQGTCSASASTSCRTSSRRKRGSNSLQVVLVMTFDFGSSSLLNDNDTATVQRYEQFLATLEESAIIVGENDTVFIFSVRVGSQYVTPDMTSIFYNATISCPAGSAAVESVCVDCPAGTKEENGQCVYCSLGEYQDQSASTDCKLCPHDLTWDLPGAISITQCILPLNTSTPEEEEKPDYGDSDDVGIVAGIAGGACAVLAVIGLAVLAVICCKNRLWAKRQRAGSKVHPLYVQPHTPGVPGLSRPSSPPCYWDAVNNAHCIPGTVHDVSNIPVPPAETKF